MMTPLPGQREPSLGLILITAKTKIHLGIKNNENKKFKKRES